MNPIAIAWRVYASHCIDGHIMRTFVGPAIGVDAEAAIRWIRETHPERTSKLSDSDLITVPLRTEILQGASEATGPHKPGQVGSTPTPAPNLPAVKSQSLQHAEPKTAHALAATVGGLAVALAMASTSAVGGQFNFPQHIGFPALERGPVWFAGEAVRLATSDPSTPTPGGEIETGRDLPKPNMGQHAIGPATLEHAEPLWRESVGWQPEPGAGSRVAGFAPSRPERLGQISVGIAAVVAVSAIASAASAATFEDDGLTLSDVLRELAWGASVGLLCLLGGAFAIACYPRRRKRSHLHHLVQANQPPGLHPGGSDPKPPFGS